MATRASVLPSSLLLCVLHSKSRPQRGISTCHHFSTTLSKFYQTNNTLDSNNVTRTRQQSTDSHVQKIKKKFSFLLHSNYKHNAIDCEDFDSMQRLRTMILQTQLSILEKAQKVVDGRRPLEIEFYLRKCVDFIEVPPMTEEQQAQLPKHRRELDKNIINWSIEGYPEPPSTASASSSIATGDAVTTETPTTTTTILSLQTSPTQQDTADANNNNNVNLDDDPMLRTYMLLLQNIGGIKGRSSDNNKQQTTTNIPQQQQQQDKQQRSNKLYRVLSVFNNMKNLGIRPTRITYNTILSYCSGEDPDEVALARSVFDEMVRASMPTATASTSANANTEAEAEANDVAPDEVTFTQLIRIYIEAGDRQKVKSLVKELKTKHGFDVVAAAKRNKEKYEAQQQQQHDDKDNGNIRDNDNGTTTTTTGH